MNTKKTRINKVVTKTGDKGYTHLIGGRKIIKSSLRIEAYGNVDELNSILGVVISLMQDNCKNESLKLKKIQNDLFIAGADLAAPIKINSVRIQQSHIDNLENLIAKYLKKLKPLKEFTLPGGCLAAAQTHFARTIARRTERSIVKLSKNNKINPLLIIYFNRLSDVLFVLARFINMKNKIKELYCNFK